MTQAETRKLNLKVPTSEEARRNGRKGGLKSAEARRTRKTFMQLAADLSEEEREEMFYALVEQAKLGSLSHLQFYLALAGEAVSKEPEQDNTIKITIGSGGDAYGD